MNIKFTDVSGLNIPKEFHPVPASRMVPDWYKETESYFNGMKKPDKNGTIAPTIKRCMPVFDAITSGYIIVSIVDVHVDLQQTDDGVVYQRFATPYLPDHIQFHPIEQATKHPRFNGFQYPKWINPWAIETPKGYSCLIINPSHRDLPFTILPGIVDTDNYVSAINFPFTLNDPEFDGFIPAGTPIAQIIPFKRDSWNMSIGNEKDLKKSQDNTFNLKSKFFDSYKNKFWNKKEFK